ncbi:TolB family protein [Cryptosporangium aurantiacum]|uniref:WD40-like Beta Propeller Repeat n=1 Tax=Cryptosporangium aurantiacum TaxID=134849 RepID=A0A1M7REV2_9ACTN|nr:PD40 domain-containing protein [Cryptosporangium aurantiacum]SHN44679.1 WD40-like Beta Propeller Repeat [Cryptosporangium aurantiacum]
MHTRRIGAVIALLAAGVLLLAPGPDRAGRIPAQLPRELAGPALTTVSVTTDTTGPAALIAGYPDLPVVGDMSGGQNVVVGADNSYRTVPSDSRLDPRGRYLLLAGEDGALTRLNLADRSTRRYDIGTDGYTVAMAIAPDGNTALVGPTPDRHTAPVQIDALHLLDLRTGESRNLGVRASAAAFSPDGTRIVVTTGDRSDNVVIDPATDTRTPGRPRGLIAGDDAWSPDGRLLAYQTFGEPTVELAPVDGASEPTTLTDVGTFLGWRDATTILVYDYGGRLRTIGTDGTAAQVMRMPERTGITDAAGALIPDLVFDETTDPDRGPWWLRFRWPLLAVTLLTLLMTAPSIVSRRRRTAV